MTATDTLLTVPPPRIAPAALSSVLRDHWGLSGTLSPLTSERDLNHRLDSPQGCFVVRLTNPAEPPEMTDFQTRAALHVAQRDPTLPLQRLVPLRDGRPLLPLPEGRLRVFTWLEGQPLHLARRSNAQRRAIGAGLARLTAALADFDHPAADHVLLWDIRQMPALAPLTDHIADPALRADCAAFIADYTAHILPVLDQMPRQVVHADFNPHNLLVSATNPDHLSGILDFGDMVRTPRACDLAVAASYQIDPADPLGSLSALISGLHGASAADRAGNRASVRPDHCPHGHHSDHHRLARGDVSRECPLHPAQCPVRPRRDGRLPRPWPRCRVAHPSRNPDMTQATGQMINAYVPGAGNLPPDQAAMAERRARLLGPAYRLFYETPVHLVRGAGCHLYDANGTAYLDCYNNVASVGHCHPRVVEAMAAQAATLATHTRYLHDGILTLADRLLALFPPALSHVMFTCTGSEANDLACRIARAATGGTGVIVTDNAYHGVTLATAQMSMSIGPAVAPGPEVFPIPAPTATNYPQGVAEGFAAAVTAACTAMRAKGIRRPC